MLDGHYVSCQGESAGSRLLATFNTKGSHRQLSLHFPPGSYNFYLLFLFGEKFLIFNHPICRKDVQFTTLEHEIFKISPAREDRVLQNNRHHSNVTKPELVGDGVAKHRKNCKCCLGHSLTVSHLPSMLWVSQFVLNSRLSLCLFLLVGHAMSPRPSDQLFERSNVSMIALQCSEDAETKVLLSP